MSKSQLDVYKTSRKHLVNLIQHGAEVTDKDALRFKALLESNGVPLEDALKMTDTMIEFHEGKKAKSK